VRLDHLLSKEQLRRPRGFSPVGVCVMAALPSASVRRGVLKGGTSISWRRPVLPATSTACPLLFGGWEWTVAVGCGLVLGTLLGPEGSGSSCLSFRTPVQPRVRVGGVWWSPLVGGLEGWWGLVGLRVWASSRW
jgi:hypothetical protein